MGDHGCSGNLPPGFIFSPSDEELILHFLDRKASLLPCHPDIIPDLGLYPQDPWQLEGRALSSENQWYYFSRVMENQATGNGFWKPLDTEEPIFSSSAGKKVGLKKYLVYCIGPEGVETNWMMQEYHLCSSNSSGKSFIFHEAMHAASVCKGISSRLRLFLNFSSSKLPCRVF